MYFDYFEVTPGPRVKDFNALLEAMTDAVTGRDEYAGERKRVLNIFYAKENQSPVTDKQVDFIYNNVLKLSPAEKSDSEVQDASIRELKREVG
jgi:CDP-glycerol glycerophosphotransferase